MVKYQTHLWSVPFLQKGAKVIVAFVATVACFVAIGWILNISVLKSLLLLTAICFAFIGNVLWLGGLNRRQTAVNEHLSLAIEGAGMAAWNIDLLTGRGVWSAQHFQLLGYELVANGEATLEMWRSRIYPDDLERVQQIEEQAKREHKLLSIEYRIIRVDNEELRWLKTFGRFFYNKAGQAVRCSGIVFDITESKQAEEERDRFFMLSNEMIAISTVDGYFKQLNPAWERVLGYTQAELMAQPFLSFVHPDDVESTRVAAERFEAGNPAPFFENRYRCKDGSYKWLSWAGVISPDRNVSYATARDVTERKLAELNEQFLNELDLRLRQLSDADAMLWEAVSSLGKYLNVDRCVWHEVNLQEDVSFVKQDWRQHEDIPSVVGMYRLSEFLLPDLVKHYYAGQPAVVSDVATYPYTAPFTDNYAQRDIRAFVGVPCIHEGLWVAVLAINARTIREWRPHEVSLLQNTVSRLWSIVEQTRATQALRESEERLHFALLNAPLPIMLHTEDGEVLQINHVWTEITGYHLEDIPTIEAWTERAYGDGKEQVRSAIQSQYPLTQRKAMGEYTLTTRTGATRIWDFQTAPLQILPDGRKLVIVTAIDVTERKQAEKEILNLNQELQRQLAESQTLLEVIPIGVGIAEDPQCQKIRVNSAFAQMLAIASTANASLSAPEDERPNNFNVYYNNQELLPEDLPLQRAAALGIEVRDLEVDVVWNDGTTLTLLEYAAPLFDERGQVRGSIGVFWNITERKRAEMALQQTLKDLADFKFALDRSSIVAITDTKGTITYVNDKFCELSQYSPEELIGQNHRIVNSGYHPKEFFQHLWATISRGEVWQGEIKNRAKDGTFYWVATTIVPFLDADGKPYQYIAVRFDITTRKVAQVELQQLNITLEQRVEERTAQLQEANKDLEAFSYTVAHDLRAPLRGIQGFAQALAEDYGDRLDETAQEYIQHIFRGTHIMNELVHDLLAYSRLSREQIKLTPVRLTQVVADARAQLATDISERQAQIAIAENLPNVMGHYPILVQIIVNLLSNAIKFVKPGIQPQIRVWAETVELKENRETCEDRPPFLQQVRLWIEDNGIGIEPNYQEQIFGVFERLHSTETYPGTGIGLAIVRKGAERLGGRAGVESAPGKGSRFWIELPDFSTFP
ncbi:PAS domain S-box protein [Scytonema sp. UIC 10036]|uniref:PAS domain S-box protein n=1 Tax=Scytonema sp. UIC 10036 TaxID=2304196 RepID=UPI0012DA3A7C|nr:PAS domain S-box protein [Scytonema sp. UIC 10036]MUG99113.1 PAS domain S-box protein [Scytonema sp. UIC 10036]